MLSTGSYTQYLLHLTSQSLLISKVTYVRVFFFHTPPPFSSEIISYTYNSFFFFFDHSLYSILEYSDLLSDFCKNLHTLSFTLVLKVLAQELQILRLLTNE